MVHRTWIVVGDAGRARVFEEMKPGKRYGLVAELEHPASRLRVADLVADTNGRKPVGGSRGENARQGGFHGRPGVEPETDPKDLEAIKFARDLASTLQKGLDDHAYEAVVLAAPPRFLGMLKEVLGPQVARRVTHTICKDLTLLAPHEIERRVRADRAA